MPLSADLEISVTETAQLEWNNTVKATFVREGDDDSGMLAIDGLTRQACERLRGTFSFTYQDSVPPMPPSSDVHFSFINARTNRRVDQEGTGRLSSRGSRSTELYTTKDGLAAYTCNGNRDYDWHNIVEWLSLCISTPQETKGVRLPSKTRERR